MRILQLIDSLDAGGAERMAVNFANEWRMHSERSLIFVTHKGGVLSKFIHSDVVSCICKRKYYGLFFVMLKLLLFIKKHKVTHIQAHTSSYKWARLIKLVDAKIIFYWHDHNGNRVGWNQAQNNQIITFSKYFDGVFCCSTSLQLWAQSNLETKNILYVPNFASQEISKGTTYLLGKSGKRIVCLANLRHPKNHVYLLEQFAASKISTQGWTLHLVGKDLEDDYSTMVHHKMNQLDLKNSVFLYGAVYDTNYVLSQADVGILVSTYEGFPVSLLEYGAMGLCPIVSCVGDMPSIIKDRETGYLVHLAKQDDLKDVFLQLNNSAKFLKMGVKFQEEVLERYSGYCVVHNLKNHL